jgi:hypothetical protein
MRITASSYSTVVATSAEHEKVQFKPKEVQAKVE